MRIYAGLSLNAHATAEILISFVLLIFICLFDQLYELPCRIIKKMRKVALHISTFILFTFGFVLMSYLLATHIDIYYFSPFFFRSGLQMFHS